MRRSSTGSRFAAITDRAPIRSTRIPCMARPRSAGPEAFPRIRICRATRSCRSSVDAATSCRSWRRPVGALAVAAVLALASASAPAATTYTHGGWCKAGSSAAWRRTLSHHVTAVSKTTAMVPLALAHDGRSFFAEVYSPRFSGVARVESRTSAVMRIKAFPDPKFDQAWGAFDGRWLVWNEYHGLDSFDDFTTWAWDSRTRKLTQIGAATRGRTVSSGRAPGVAPTFAVGLRRGYRAWGPTSWARSIP